MEEALKGYLMSITGKYSPGYVADLLENLNNLRVLVIGDTIIDEYCFVDPRGGSAKDPMLTVDYVNEEAYAGGILAIANHISNFVKEVEVVTLIGGSDDYSGYISTHLHRNMKHKLFIKKNSPTTKKRRYINRLRHEKIFMVEDLNDVAISLELENEILAFLEKKLPFYDLVVVGDFGHGFINEKIIAFLEEKAKYLALNVQTNSANLGFNFVTKYNQPSFISMDGAELRFAVMDKHSDVSILLKKLHQKKGFKKVLVTLGKEGIAYFKDGRVYQGPALTTEVKDIVGAGDAVFSLASLLVSQECDPECMPFLANCAGGVAVQIMGNKESITKEKVIHFVNELYKQVKEEQVHRYFQGVHNALENVDKEQVNSFADLLLETYECGGTIYAFGNGGSGATASHFCGDLVKGVSYGLEKRFRAICLNDNIPAMMAIANDISYDDIFIEQLKNFLTPKDLIVGISGSGNSINIVKALEFANSMGAKTVAICGYKGGRIKEISTLSVHAPVEDMEVSEDIHNLIITHCIKQILAKKLQNSNLGEEYVKRIS